MRPTWKVLHQKVAASVRTPGALARFETLRKRLPGFEPFETPEHLFQFLTGPSPDLDAKDELLRRLVELVQRQEEQELAGAVLWLGLRPGLDSIYWRRLRHFLPGESDLCSCIAEAFVSLVRGIALDKNSRIAAALVRGTERGVIDGYRLTVVGPARDRHSDELGKCADEARAKPSLDEELAALLLWLRPLVGDDDAVLVVAVLVMGESQREAALRIGISHDAARKRYRRALGTLRRAIAKRPSHFDVARARLSLAGSLTCSTHAARASGPEPTPGCEAVAAE